MDNKKIGATLTRLRGDKTQKTVAGDLGISLSALAMYEGGYWIPRDEIKVRISQYYGKSVQEIFFASECHKKGQESNEDVEGILEK